MRSRLISTGFLKLMTKHRAGYPRLRFDVLGEPKEDARETRVPRYGAPPL